MLVLAAVEWSSIIPLVIGILGIAGLIFTALKYNRDDTTAVLTQQNTIVSEMKMLNDELRLTTVHLREERDALKVQVEDLSRQVDRLRFESRD